MSGYSTTNYFKPGACNTICDVTGFKKKSDEVMRRWEGYYVIPAAWNPRQPQDFPPEIIEPKTFPNARFEQAQASTDVESYDII